MSEVIKWMYLSDIVKKLDTIMFICCTFSAMGLALSIVAYYVERVKFFKKLIICLSFFLPIFILISLSLPSERTMLTIVASKAGETVINTDIGKKAMLLLNKKLDEALKDK